MSDYSLPRRLPTPGDIAERLKEIFGMQDDVVPAPIHVSQGYSLDYSQKLGAYRLKGDLGNLVGVTNAIKEAGMVGIRITEMKCPDGNDRYIAERATVQRYKAILNGTHTPASSPSVKPPTREL